MSTSTTAQVSRRFMLGVLAAMPALPTLFAATTARAQNKALASWNDGPAKQAIFDFVKATTDRASPNYVPPEDRIATFDQDGTLWVEHPLYAQAFFALDRVHEMAPQHPEWKTHEPFKAVLTNDLAALAHFSERDWAEIIFVTHAGMSQAEFLEIVTKWLATAKHPRFKRLFTELIYQPMIEVLEYLRANQFETFIVTGGGQDFVRAYSPACLWHPDAEGHRLQPRHEIRIQGWQGRADAAAEAVLQRQLTTARQSASTCSSASAPMRPSATPPAIARCWNILARATVRG